MISPVKNIDDYLAIQPEKVVVALEKIRQTVLTVVPKAEEVISYGIPAFKHKGKILVYFAGFKNHCSFFPGSKSVILKFKNELKTFKTSAGTISFTVEKPLSASLVKKIVKAKLQENRDKLKNKQLNKK